MAFGWKRVVVVVLAGLLVFAVAPALGKKHRGNRPPSFGVKLHLSYSESTGNFKATADSPKRVCEDMRPLKLLNYPYGGGSPHQVGRAVTNASGTAVFKPEPGYPFQAGIYAVSAGKETLEQGGATVICRLIVSTRNHF